MDHSTRQNCIVSRGRKMLSASIGSLVVVSTCFVTSNPQCSSFTTIELRPIRVSKSAERSHKRKQVREIIEKYAPRNQKNWGMANLIVQRSLRAGFDPLFVAAIIKSESTFRPNAVSNKGAKGLMQVTRIAEKEMVRRGEATPGFHSITNPAYNIDVGLRYLRHLEKQFGGNRMIALVAYNCGPTKVMKALDGDNSIPAESFHYARTIIDDHQSWVTSG